MLLGISALVIGVLFWKRRNEKMMSNLAFGVVLLLVFAFLTAARIWVK
jgi:hypothetical protein